MTIALFAAGICLGVAGAFVWAWGVRTGQFRDLEKTKEQLFWPEIAPEDGGTEPPPEAGKPDGGARRIR